MKDKRYYSRTVTPEHQALIDDVRELMSLPIKRRAIAERTGASPATLTKMSRGAKTGPLALQAVRAAIHDICRELGREAG